jgi:WD40 repeat protein
MLLSSLSCGISVDMGNGAKSPTPLPPTATLTTIPATATSTTIPPTDVPQVPAAEPEAAEPHAEQPTAEAAAPAPEPTAVPAAAAQVINRQNAASLTLQRISSIGLGSLQKLTVSPDGKSLLLSYSTQLVLLNASDFTLIWKVDPGRVLSDVVFTKDGKHLVSYSPGGTLLLFDAATGASLKAILPQREGVVSMALSAHGEYFAILDFSGVSKVYDTSNGNEVMKNNGQSYPGGLNNVLLTPGGGTLLIDGMDSKPRKQVQQWNVTDGKYKIGLLGVMDEMDSWKFSPDAKRVFGINRRSLTSVPANTLTAWNAANGALIKSYDSIGIITDYVISPDGASILVATTDNKIHLLNTESGKEKGTFSGHTTPVAGMDFTPDSQGVISLEASGKIILWDVAGMKTVTQRDGALAFPRTGVMFSPDGRKAVIISTDRKAVWIIDLPSSAIEKALNPEQSNLRAPAISVASDLAAAVDEQNHISIWEIAGGKKLQVIAAKTRSPITKIKFSPDGKSIASLSNGQVFIWDVASGGKKAEFAGKFDLAWSADGRFIASDSTDNRLYLTDTTTGKKVAALDAEAITSINYSTDGSLISVGGTRVQPKERGLINLVFQFDSGSRVRLPVEMPKLAGAVISTAYSPDKSLLAGIDSQGNVYLWNLSDGNREAYFEEVAANPGTLMFNNEGTLLYVAGSDGAIGVISTLGGAVPAELQAQTGQPEAAGDANTVPELSSQAYTHSKGSVSAKLPMGWKINEPTSLSFLSSDPKARGFIAFTAINTVKPLTDDAFASFINGSESGLAASISDYKEINRGIEAAKGTGFVSKTVTLSGVPYMFETYYDRDGSVIRETSFITQTTLVGSFIPLYQGVYASLKVDNTFVDKQMPYAETTTLIDKDNKFAFDVPAGWWLDPSDTSNKYKAPDGSGFAQQMTIPWDDKTMTDSTAIFGSIQTAIENQEGYVTMLRRDKQNSGGWQITYSVSSTNMTGIATGIKVDNNMQIINFEYPTSLASKLNPLAVKINNGLKLK